MITGETIVELGLERFPELYGAYEAMMQEWQEKFPGRYNVYMEVFRPLLVSSLDRGDQIVIHRFADFFEEVCVDGDDEARNVIHLKFFRWLFSHESYFLLLFPDLKPVTRAEMRNSAWAYNLSPSIKKELSC